MTEKGQGLGRVRALQLAARDEQSSRGCLHRLLCRLHCHRSIPGRDHRPGRAQDDGQPSGMSNWLDNGVTEGQGIWRRFRTTFHHSWNLPMLHLLPFILSWISLICVLVSVALSKQTLTQLHVLTSSNEAGFISLTTLGPCPGPAMRWALANAWEVGNWAGREGD